MSEAIAETDDELMEKFFGGEPFTTEEIVEGMRKGVKDGLITPVFCGSAVNMQALDMLLYNMDKLLPSPAHARASPPRPKAARWWSSTARPTSPPQPTSSRRWPIPLWAS